MGSEPGVGMTALEWEETALSIGFSLTGLSCSYLWPSGRQLLGIPGKAEWRQRLENITNTGMGKRNPPTGLSASTVSGPCARQDPASSELAQ